MLTHRLNMTNKLLFNIFGFLKGTRKMALNLEPKPAHLKSKSSHIKAAFYIASLACSIATIGISTISAHAQQNANSGNRGDSQRVENNTTTPNNTANNATNANNTITLDTIVVTGEKTQRSLQHTANSVSVIRASDIDAQPYATTITDILKKTPNVLYTNDSDAPIIRGIDAKGPLVRGNAYLANPVPRVSMSVDGRYLTPSELGIGAASMWDVESVEVFRGPQTTSQGANAIAGAVVINTKDPTFTPEFESQVLYGSREKKRASFVVSGPILPDLAGRIAFDYGGRDTFISYTNPNFLDRDMDNETRSINSRVKLLWQPAEIPGLEAKLTYSHSDVKRPASEIASRPFYKLDDTRISTDNVQTKADAGILDLKYDFGNTIIVSNKLQYSKGVYDYNFGKSFNGTAGRNSDNIANELSVNFGDEMSTWSGLAGVYISNSKTVNKLLHQFASADFTVNQDSIGIYSELTYRFLEKWHLTGGLRYQRDTIKHDGVASYVPGIRHIYDESFDAILPKISLSYDITEDVTVGALVSKGYLPGGTGLNFSGKRYYNFNAEEAWNYELFARVNVLDSNLIFTSNLFYTDYKHSQRSVTDYMEGRPFGSIIINSDKAETYGLELGGEYQLFNPLRLRGGLGLLHSKISNVGDIRGDIFNGKKFAKSPGFMFNLGADWDIVEQLRLSADVRYTDDYYSTDDNDPSLRIGSYAIANMQLSYRPNENLEIFAYGNNLFNERVPMEKSLDRAAGIQAYVTEPREFGIGLKTKF